MSIKIGVVDNGRTLTEAVIAVIEASCNVFYVVDTVDKLKHTPYDTNRICYNMRDSEQLKEPPHYTKLNVRPKGKKRWAKQCSR